MTNRRGKLNSSAKTAHSPGCSVFGASLSDEERVWSDALRLLSLIQVHGPEPRERPTCCEGRLFIKLHQKKMAYLGQEEVLSTLWLVNRLVKDSCCLVFASIRQHLVLTLCIYTKCNFSMSLRTGSDCLEDVISCLCPRSCRSNRNLTPFSGFFFCY